MVGVVNLTLVTLRVLNAFMEAPNERQYGLGLMKRTGLASGTLYPVLARLERIGWLRSAQEDIDPATEKRPARRYYEITPDGLAQARIAKAEALAELGSSEFSPSRGGHPHLRPQGSTA